MWIFFEPGENASILPVYGSVETRAPTAQHDVAPCMSCGFVVPCMPTCRPVLAHAG